MTNKIAICCIVKNENLYINEWINYHLNLGVNHIYIYDNNDINGENPKDVICNDNVTIIDYRGKHYVQNWAYTECYRNYHSKYNWFIFIDIDEFIILNNITLNEFLNLDRFNNTNIIRLNWKHYSDNGLIDVINNDYTVYNRFITQVKYKKDISGKSIIRCTLDIGKNLITCHGYYNDETAVDENGNKCYNTSYNINKEPTYNTAWINHYSTKTIGEYIRQKYFRGDATRKEYDSKYSNLDHFFEINERTKEKEEYANKLLNEMKNKCINLKS